MFNRLYVANITIFLVVLLMCLNFPPWLRSQLGFMVLVGVIPGPKCRNPQAYLQHVADQFDFLFEGMSVYDAHEQRSVSVTHIHTHTH